MKLIIGLGNPGKKYEKTRHNAGYMALDLFAETNKMKFKLETKFQGELAVGIINRERVILLKPATYMNLSANAISLVINYYKIHKGDVLVVFDDISLLLGKIRLRNTGSSGGHNGIKNIISLLGEEFFRVKIGIEKGNTNTVDYVLGKFAKIELEALQPTFYKVTEIIRRFTEEESFEILMNDYN